jgi:hypothetical protein
MNIPFGLLKIDHLKLVVKPVNNILKSKQQHVAAYTSVESAVNQSCFVLLNPLSKT